MAPGVGKRIAQRVILELKDKIGKESPGFSMENGVSVPTGGSAGSSGKLADAAAALGVLGYGNSEISAAFKGVNPEGLEVQDLVRLALKKMVR